MNTKLLILAGLAASLAACSNDEESPSSRPDPLTDTPIAVTVAVDDLSSRAGYDNTNPPTGFVMYLKQNAGLGYSTDASVNCNYNYGGVYMVKENETWTAKNSGGIPVLWKNSNPDAGLIAYTDASFDSGLGFSNSEPDSRHEVKVMSDQSSNENLLRSDWLYKSMEKVNPDAAGNVNINFEHFLSKLKVVLKRGTELDETVTFSDVTVDGCVLNGEGNMVSGMVKALSDVQSISMFQTDSDNWECILIPQTVGSLTVRINTSDGKVYEYVSADELVFNQKELNTLTLTVGYDKVTVDGFTAQPWSAENEAGDLETE